MIQSANPQVVYVPIYNPAVVYGYPYVTPGYSAATVAATGMLAFGAGIAVGAMMSGGCCGWGYSSWNCGWHGTTTVVYRGGAYYGNTAWHGGYYGSNGYGGSAHYGTSYNPTTGTYARGGTVSNGYGSATAGKAYNPSTGTYARGASTSNAHGTQSAAQSLQPKDRGIRADAARFQCQWKLGKLDGFEKRQHGVQPASNDLSRYDRVGENFEWWLRLRRVG